jgi:hypothetical protein
MAPLTRVRAMQPGATIGRPATMGSIVLMSAWCVTDWTWPQVQVAVSRRLLLQVRKVVQVMPDGDLQNVRGGP